MSETTEHSWQSHYQDLAAERFTLAAQLRLPNTFKSPQERSEAAKRFKAITSQMNALYLEKNGLR